MSAQDPEVIALLDDVRQRVRARMADADRTALHDADDQALAEIQAALQDVNVNARINSHLPLLWEDMVVGRARALTQRLVRRLLRWYINPIVDQQNVFNAATAKAVTLLASENARLRRRQSELADRVAEIEKGKVHNDRDNT